MADGEQLIYPKVFLAQGNGDLVQVTNFTITLTNNAKQVHTLRRKGAGITLGTEECSISFDFAIDEDGPERNYWRDVKTGTVRQLRAKGPNVAWTVNGAYQGCDLDAPLDDATKGSATFIGHMEEVRL
jgi:hypothetical protein